MKKFKPSGGLSLVLTLVLLCPIAAIAQTTSATEVRNFEVISVDGNNLVVRDELGTREITVPADFRFTVDGKSMAVSELKAGMKGTATVTTTTTSRPVYVTQVKQGQVVKQTGTAVFVRDENGKTHRFNQTAINSRGIQIFLDGKPVRVDELHPGQRLTATIVTAAPPEVLTEKQVNAVLAQPDAPVEEVIAANTEAPPADAPAAAEPVAEPVAEPMMTAEAAPAPAESASYFETLPKPFFRHPFFMLLLFIIAVALVWVLVRRRKAK